MPAAFPPLFEICGCEVDFTPGTLSRRQPPLSYAHCNPESISADPAPNVPGRCERHQTEWLKSHEEGLLAYMDLKVTDAESKLAAAQIHKDMYSKWEMRYKKRQLKAEETIRGMAALGLWSRYPATWGLWAVTTGGRGETGLVKLEDVTGMADETEKKLDDGWEDEDEEVEAGSEDRRKGKHGGVEETGKRLSQNASLEAKLGRESHSRAADQKWYWWW